MLMLPVQRARELCQAVLEHLGFTPAEVAACTGAYLFASLRGLDSHGIVSLLPAVAGAVKSGLVQPNARVITLKETSVTVAYRGNGAAGPVVASSAMRAALDRARQHGVGIATVANAAHFGAASAYAAMAPPQGMIGLVMCNAGAMVAPFGGVDRLHGTNPIAYAAPAGSAPPVVLDIATSAAAHGQISKALRRGEAIPPGWALDRQGRPTTDAAAAMDGVLLPFGGHKGYGLGILVDLLTGALTGSTIARGVRQGSPDRATGGQAYFLLAIDVAAFTELATFQALADQLVHDAKAIPPAEGFAEVLLPGELEAREQARRSRAGIPLAEADWDSMVSRLTAAGVPGELCLSHAPD